MASSTSPSPSPPQMHVTVHLPPIISFSSPEKPQLEIHLTLQHTHSIIIPLKRSKLYPLHLQTAITLTHVADGKPEYVPRVDYKASHPPILTLKHEHKEDFVGLRPGETSIVKVNFRPHDEPYDYEKMKNEGIDRYRFIFPIGMQFLKPGEEYEISLGAVEGQEYMIGDLEDVIGGDGSEGEWKAAEGSAEVVVGEGCRSRVEA